MKIPQLKRLIVSQGEMVIMEPSLEEGFAKLNERLKAKAERIQQRLQLLAPPKKEQIEITPETRGRRRRRIYGRATGQAHHGTKG